MVVLRWSRGGEGKREREKNTVVVSTGNCHCNHRPLVVIVVKCVRGGGGGVVGGGGPGWSSWRGGKGGGRAGGTGSSGFRLPSPLPASPAATRLAGGTMTTATAWREGSQWGGCRGAEAPARGPPVRRKGQARRADAIRGARPVRAPEAGVTSGGSGRGRRDMQMRSVGTGVTSGGSCAREAVIRK